MNRAGFIGSALVLAAAAWLAGCTRKAAGTQVRDLPANGEVVYGKYLDMMGGRRTLESIRSVSVQGKRLQAGVLSTFELRARRTGEFVLRVQHPDGTVHRTGCTARGQGWVEEEGVVRTLLPAALEERRLMILPYLPLMEFRWRPLLASLKCEPAREGEKRLIQLSGGQAQQRLPRLLFEPETWRLRRLGRYTFREFRLAEGVFVPFVIRDGPTVYQAASVQFIQPMADAEFDRPPSPPPPRLVQPD